MDVVTGVVVVVGGVEAEIMATDAAALSVFDVFGLTAVVLLLLLLAVVLLFLLLLLLLLAAAAVVLGLSRAAGCSGDSDASAVSKVAHWVGLFF